MLLEGSLTELDYAQVFTLTHYSHLPPPAPDRIPFLHIGIMLRERVGEDVPAGPVRHEVQRARPRRIEHRVDARPPGIGDPYAA